MEDLFGAYVPKELRPVQTLTHQKSVDLLSFDSPSAQDSTPAKTTRQVQDVSRFVSSSPVSQWKEASPRPKAQPFGLENKDSDTVEDEFGDFQGNEEDQRANKPFDSALVSSPRVREANTLVIANEEDEFGEFVDSPLPRRDAFLSTPTVPITSLDVPGPTELLKFLLEFILQVPTSFFAELSTVSYSLRKVVLRNSRTKKWLQAVLEGAAVAQRIIRGRNRRARDVQQRREAQIATDRLTQHWKESLMPRLSSLAGGTLKIGPLKTNAFNDNYSEDKICLICKTEKDASMLSREPVDGGLYHKSCLSLLNAYNTSRH